MKKIHQGNYYTKLLYIDTRDVKRFKKDREYSYLLAVDLARSIESRGVVFILEEKHNVLEYRKILNEVLPHHKYSYSDGLFFVGYIQASNSPMKEIIINLTRMPKRCLPGFILDLEQAIVRNKIDDPDMRRRWKNDIFLCESSEFIWSEEPINLERIVKYVNKYFNINF